MTFQAIYNDQSYGIISAPNLEAAIDFFAEQLELTERDASFALITGQLVITGV